MKNLIIFILLLIIYVMNYTILKKINLTQKNQNQFLDIQYYIYFWFLFYF